jgi:p-hydroxybenzoate 3-monooxygenase
VTSDRTTVAIVGAGPAGLVLGYLLQRDGIPFVLFERHCQEELRAYPKAGLIEYRTVQILTAEGIAGSVLAFDHDNHCCEFRTPDEHIVFEYGTLTGGRHHFIYPQHELVANLCEAVVAAGGDVRFAAELTEAHDHGDGVTVQVVDPLGRPSSIEAEVVVACDGVRGAVSRSLDSVTVVKEALPVRWLAVIATAPPLEPHTIYAAHPRGFAGQMRRSATATRYMLEVPASDSIADWPEDRVRDEISVRLGIAGPLAEVSFVEPSLVDLRMRMVTHMQHGRTFLAGDAAHLITRAGGRASTRSGRTRRLGR